jgi:hypothetical protein
MKKAAQRQPAHLASFRTEKSTTVGTLAISQPQRGSQLMKFARFLTVGRNAGPSSALSQQAIINFARGETFDAQIKAAEDPNLEMIMRAFNRAFIFEAADKAGERVSKLILLWRRIHWLQQQDGLNWYSNELERSEFIANAQSKINCIFVGPDGKYVVEPLCEQEDVIIADLDLDALDRERMTLDVSGHYNRSDLFAFQVETKG